MGRKQRKRREPERRCRKTGKTTKKTALYLSGCKDACIGWEDTDCWETFTCSERCVWIPVRKMQPCCATDRGVHGEEKLYGYWTIAAISVFWQRVLLLCTGNARGNIPYPEPEIVAGWDESIWGRYLSVFIWFPAVCEQITAKGGIVRRWSFCRKYRKCSTHYEYS